jgi:hypothetical protein
MDSLTRRGEGRRRASRRRVNTTALHGWATIFVDNEGRRHEDSARADDRVKSKAISSTRSASPKQDSNGAFSHRMQPSIRTDGAPTSTHRLLSDDSTRADELRPPKEVRFRMAINAEMSNQSQRDRLGKRRALVELYSTSRASTGFALAYLINVALCQ